MYVDRERARERDKLHKKCVSERARGGDQDGEEGRWRERNG